MTTAKHGPGYEQSDVAPRLPLSAAVMALLFLALVLGLIGWAFALRDDSAPRPTDFFKQSLEGRHNPDLQAEPQQDLRRMRAISEQGLHGYGWVDREAGVVHIPIERAMALYARRHGDGEPHP